MLNELEAFNPFTVPDNEFKLLLKASNAFLSALFPRIESIVVKAEYNSIKYLHYINNTPLLLKKLDHLKVGFIGSGMMEL